MLKTLILCLLSVTAHAAGLLRPGGGGYSTGNNSTVAANATATSNPLCTAIQPFYAEIGNASTVLWSIQFGSVGRTNTALGVDSASKWIYSYYIAQIRGSLAAYTSADIAALNMLDGYINVGEGNDPSYPLSTCPPSLAQRTPAGCLVQIPGPNGQQPPNGQNFGALITNQGPGTVGIPGTSAVGVYIYQGAHDEVHAANHSPLANFTDPQITVAIGNQTGSQMSYVQPLLSGGAAATAAQYATMLQNMLSNTYYKTQILPSIHTTCTFPGGNYSNQTVGGVTGPTNCTAQYSPINGCWQYALGFWVETGPSVATGSCPAENGDGAYSSPGSDGYYPWIDKTMTYYGIIARSAGAGQGYASAQCGRLIRQAWLSGVQQTGTIPSTNIP